MLVQLRIQNYVLIDDLEMNVSGGLTIITGETGAGKTILLGALSLILGNRADTAALRDKTKKCIIEGQFDIKEYDLVDFFERNGLDYEPVSSLRREVNPEGKSRAFINDTPVNLNQLKELGSLLVDIHSQHETLTLQQSGFQLQVLDGCCDHQAMLVSYRNEFKKWKQSIQELNILTESEKKSKADQDYYQFQFDELDSAALRSGEQDALQQELETLSNAEEIKSKLSQGVNMLQQGEMNVIAELENVFNLLRPVVKFNEKIDAESSRIKSALIEIKDIASALEGLEQHIQYDSERIGTINERLNLIFGLQQKHRVSTIDDLLLLRDELSSRLLQISSLDNTIHKLNEQVLKQREALMKTASQLSKNRSEAARQAEKEIKDMLKEVGMPHATLKIEQQEMEEPGENGIDKIKFLFSANKGVAMQELSRVASGGEMSRLMLCIKAMMARKVTMPTIIFDEIDSGISGEVAFKVGSIIEKISSRHQVMAITHLPQMASRGDAHLQVYKRVTGKTTHTGIRSLDQQERINEIAKMLSGNELTDAALENAKELLAK